MKVVNDIALIIARVDGSCFRVNNGYSVAKSFFQRDPSSCYSVERNGYDAWILSNGQNPLWFHSITPRDIHIINGSNMHMRSPMSAWQSLLTLNKLSALEDIDVSWSLTEISESDWNDVSETIYRAIAYMLQFPGISIAGITKILHMKRPYLIPILDTYVGNVLSSPKPSNKNKISRWTRLIIDQIYAIGRTNQEALTTIHNDLQEIQLIRTPIRVLDAILWSAMPGSPFYDELSIDNL